MATELLLSDATLVPAKERLALYAHERGMSSWTTALWQSLTSTTTVTSKPSGRCHDLRKDAKPMPRNSFIQMTKLSNLSGRIDYITSDKRQENLYATFATTNERGFWRQLARCNQEEFKKSGSAGKCIEARELIIALPESFKYYEPEAILDRFCRSFKRMYRVECIAALHHNKRKTNLHIHLIFAERTKLREPVEKIATRNMFYIEEGIHVRTKKEITDANGTIRDGCKVIAKGDVYERTLFSVKDKRFKKEEFLDEVKAQFTELINVMVPNKKEKLTVFQKNGVYLATKKIGKNNPMEKEIADDNAIRQKWNATVDHALVSGVEIEDILETKKKHINERIKLSYDIHGYKPELFSSIVKTAITMLNILIDKVVSAVKVVAEKVIPFSVEKPEPTKPEHKQDVAKKAEPKVEAIKKTSPKQVLAPSDKIVTLATDSSITTPSSVKVKASVKSTIPPRPKITGLAAEYNHLSQIREILKDQNEIIFAVEHKRALVEIERDDCSSMWQASKKRNLTEQIEVLNKRADRLKGELAVIVREYGFDTVENFYAEYNAALYAYGDYQSKVKEWDNKYGENANKESVHNKLERYQYQIRDERKEEPETSQKITAPSRIRGRGR